MTAIVPAVCACRCCVGFNISRNCVTNRGCSSRCSWGGFINLCIRSIFLEVARDVLHEIYKNQRNGNVRRYGRGHVFQHFLVNGGNDLIREFLATFNPSKTQLIILMLGAIFLLGFILDWVAIVLICMPILPL